jgi:hypothetical protein
MISNNIINVNIRKINRNKSVSRNISVDKNIVNKQTINKSVSYIIDVFFI